METRRCLGGKGEHVEEVQEQAVGGGPAARREEALHGEGDQGVVGVQGAGETGHETTLEDIDDLLSDSDNNDLF
jgi:hypothetical protein